MTDAKTIEKNLKEEAKKLLESGAVSVVLGYARGYDEKHPMPFAAACPEDADSLVFNEYCTANMARYIVRYPAGTKTGRGRERRGQPGRSRPDPGRQGQQGGPGPARDTLQRPQGPEDRKRYRRKDDIGNVQSGYL